MFLQNSWHDFGVCVDGHSFDAFGLNEVMKWRGTGFGAE